MGDCRRVLISSALGFLSLGAGSDHSCFEGWKDNSSGEGGGNYTSDAGS